MSEQDIPKTWAYELWKHLHDEHGLILLESELQEIVEISRRIDTENPQLPLTT